MKNKKRIGCLVTLMMTLLSGTAALAVETPPVIAGDSELDIRYPFGWGVPRTGHALVYDAARTRVVVYGGTTSDRACPTLEWDGAYWKGVWTTNVPPATTGHAMAYDAERGVTVLFGGGNALDETWLYDGTNWTRATPAVSPPGRAQHAMAYDSVSRRVLLYGGTRNPGMTGFDDSYLKDFWAWNGVNWTELGGVPTNMPPLRGHVMACDTNRSVTVLYGGKMWGLSLGYFNGIVTNWSSNVQNPNTWEWNGTTWLNRNLSLGVVPNSFAMTYDTDSKRILATVGRSGSMIKLYAYDGVAWVKTNEGPVGVSLAWGPVAYDAARHEAVVVPSDGATWLYRGANWCSGGFYFSQGAEETFSSPLLFSDFNGDRRPDLLMPGNLPNASSNGYSKVVALFTNGPSGFDYRPVSWALGSANTAARGDMNGDGLPDLALGRTEYSGSSVSTSDVRVLAGGYNGTFASTSCWSQTVSTWEVLELAWPDVNRDGWADLAVLYTDPNTRPHFCGVAVYTNRGATLATNPAVNLVFTNMIAVYGCMAWEDGNRDGFVDMAISMQSDSNGVPDTVRVYTNNGAGNVSAAQVLGEYAGAIQFADLNGDWWPDIVGPGFAYTNHLGSFGPEPSWKAGLLNTYPFDSVAIDVGDVDGDGDPDVAVFSRDHIAADIEAFVYRNDAGILTEFPAWSAAAVSQPVGTDGALGDAEGDGILDVATKRGIYLLQPLWQSTSQPLSAPMWLRAGVNPADRTTALVEWDPVPGTDVGGYRVYNISKRLIVAELPATQTQFVATPDDRIVYVATVDKAGREYGSAGPAVLGSLKATNSTADSTADFWWESGDYYSGGTFVGDLDGDGDLDLFVATTSLHPVPDKNRTRWLVYTNNGAGNFGLAWEWRQSENPADLHGPGRVTPKSLGDINGDGLPDLVGAAERVIINTNTSLTETRWVLDCYTNSGGVFVHDPRWNCVMPLGNTSGAMTWGDANGDGRQDLVVGSFSGGSAFLFLNQGDGLLGSVPAWASSVSSASYVAFGALDSDGKADLAIANGTTMGATVYKGTSTGLAVTPAWADTQSSIAGRPSGIAWADFDGDGDGDKDLTVFGSESSSLRNHPTVLYSNNGGALAYLCVYKSRDYKDGQGVGIGGGGNGSRWTKGWADMNHDGHLDLWGGDLILAAATPQFNAGPIGSQPANWYGDAGEEGWGRHPPWSGVQGVYDFNGDGTPDDFLAGALMLRTPNCICQADYVKYIPPAAPANAPPQSGTLKLYPSGTLVLDGYGATQAIDVVLLQPDQSEVPVPYTPDYLSISIAGNPGLGTPYATVSNNVVTAVRDGTVTLNVKYGNYYSSVHPWVGIQFIEATKTVRIVNAPWLPDVLGITPPRVTLERIGETATLTVSRQHPDGRIEDVTARSTWQVSDAGVVSMADQVAIARGNGVADVVATFEGMSATSRVTVAASAALAGLTLFPPEASVRVGEKRGFEVRARFTDGTVQPVTFVGALASDAPGIAAVDGLRVLGVSPGFAQVTATYLGQTATARVAVDAAVTNAPAEPPLCEILGLQHQGGNVALDWYCTTPSGQYTPFSVLTSTNLQTGPWTPIQTPVPRHPSGYHSWTCKTNESASIFYKITSP
jgi:hypothetical protein